MAKTQTPTNRKDTNMSKSNAVATRNEKAGALAEMPMMEDFAADAGKGFKNVDADSVAIPFLAVLQKSSPQCDPDNTAEYNPDAKPGMFFNTVTRELFDGRDGISIIPCEFRRRYLCWGAREAGGGFKGEFMPEDIVRQRESGKLVELDSRLYVPDEHGNVNPKRNDRMADTRIHYVLVLNPKTGAAQQAVLSLASTQVKKSKQLISLLGDVAITRPDGSRISPPSFANVVRVTTVPEQNEKGSWSGVKFELQGFVQDSATYAMAKQFHTLVATGRAEVNYEAAANTGSGEDSANSGEGRGW